MAMAEFSIRRKVLVLTGASFHIYNAEGEQIGFCRQKAFRLKEDLRIYSDDSQSHERLRIRARKIIDFGAGYDVYDSQTNELLGTLRRKGFASILRDEWQVLDTADTPIGRIREDSLLMAMVRRWVLKIIPQSFHLVDDSGEQYAQFKTHFNPFIHRMSVVVDDDCPVSPMLILAAGLLLAAIEGRQS